MLVSLNLTAPPNILICSLKPKRKLTENRTIMKANTLLRRIIKTKDKANKTSGKVRKAFGSICWTPTVLWFLRQVLRAPVLLQGLKESAVDGKVVTAC